MERSMPRLARILVVDDLIDYLQSLTNALEGDFDVVAAASLSDAKEKVNEEIGLILSDIRLSETDPNNKDGIALLEWSKKNFPEIPVVLMTVYRDFDIAVDALNLGAAKFLKKPINISELKETLNDVLKGRMLRS